jgi:hypothetical protein
MNFTVCGCGISFKASGLRCHQRQSLDIRCQSSQTAPFDDYGDGDCDMSENMDINPQDFITDIIENIPGAEYTEFEVDPAGDLFGDYQDYISEEFGMDCLDSESYVSDDESEGTIDEEDFILTNHSEILEPERLPPSESSILSCPSPDNLNSDEMESTTKPTIIKASHLRGGAEEDIQKRPFVVKFTKGKAGATYTNQRVEGDNLNASYRRKVQVANAENPSPYRPFSSKLEWEIAR